MTRQRHTLHDERGFALFYMAVFLTMLLIFVGLAVDTGRAYVVQAQLSKAVDGAALGAARMNVPSTSSTSCMVMTIITGLRLVDVARSTRPAEAPVKARSCAKALDPDRIIRIMVHPTLRETDFSD